MLEVVGYVIPFGVGVALSPLPIIAVLLLVLGAVLIGSGLSGLA